MVGVLAVLCFLAVVVTGEVVVVFMVTAGVIGVAVEDFSLIVESMQYVAQQVESI